eukprot:COSAG04_NODE_5695_length_1522_cov_19.036543_1_plen_492_part_10
MNKRVMLSSAQRWNQRGLTKCLVSWQSWTLHKVAVRDMLKKVILRIQSLRCASAFDAWSRMLIERRRLANLAEKCIRRMRNLLLARVFSSFWHHCLLCRNVCATTANWRYRRIRVAFGELVGVARQSALDRAWEKQLSDFRLEVQAYNADVEAGDHTSTRRIIVATAQRWKHRDLTKCLSSWKSWAHARHARRTHVRVLSARSILRLQNLAMASSYDAWSGWGKRRLRVRSICAKSVARVQHLAMASSFDAWSAWSAHHRHVQSICAKSVARVQHLAVARALSSWSGWSSRHRHVRSICAKSVARVQHLAMALSFDAWSAWSSRHRHVQSICAKSLARLQNLAVSKVWSAWWYQRCLMVRVRGMAIKMRHLALSKAFDAWLTLSVRRRYVRSVCKKSLARLQNLAVSRAWSAWWSLRCLMVRVRAMMTRTRHRIAVSCVHAWSGRAARRRRLQSLRTKCLVKMLQRVLVTAFDAWMELANAQTVRRASESRL